MKILKHGTRRYVTALLISCLLVWTSTSCRIHSPLQEELAKDVQGRYKLVSPSALQALEILDSDLDRLVESERADFEIYKETSENVLINITWKGYRKQVMDLQEIFYPQPGGAQAGQSLNCKEPRVVVEIGRCIEEEKTASQDLDARIKELDGIIKSINKAISKAEENPTLPEKLAESKIIINGVLAAVDAAVKKDPNSPLAKRLSQSVGEIDKFIGQLSENEKNKENNKRVFSLVIEAMRLGRDITALEKEAVEQEQNYHGRLVANFQAMQEVLPRKTQLEKMLSDHSPAAFPDDEMVRERIGLLARQSSQDEETASSFELEATEEERQAAGLEQQGSAIDAAARSSRQANKAGLRSAAQLRSSAEAHRRQAQNLRQNASQLRKSSEQQRESMRQILQNLAGLQTINVTNEMRLKELDLRRSAEKYRNAKLKDVIYERQRITLISYGLEGAVRYAEGGLRSEDIASLINIARMIAEFIIAARV